jgi:hypothetical protein
MNFTKQQRNFFLFLFLIFIYQVCMNFTKQQRNFMARIAAATSAAVAG